MLPISSSIINTIFTSTLIRKFHSPFCVYFRYNKFAYSTISAQWQKSALCLDSSTQIEPEPQAHQQVYSPVIGLEVHAQLQTNSKLFSSAPTAYLALPNSQVAPFDLSLPGTLPVLNRAAVELAIKTAFALNCNIQLRSSFDRKHYFYGDMPNGYQITQQRQPIARDGYIDFVVYDEYEHFIYRRKLNNSLYDKSDASNIGLSEPYLKRCRLKQIQLEQDSGKSLVDAEGGQSLIDLNRAGVPLIEFVFEPDLESPLEATSLVRELINRLLAVGVCSCKMDQGALRVDANVSIRPLDSATELGTRTEIKNLNSFRFLRDAIQYEILRQSKLLTRGDTVINETFTYDMRTKQTVLMRDKEVVQDYRFMPEPNLPPILLRDSSLPDHCTTDENLIDIESIRRLVPFYTFPPAIRTELSRSKFGLSYREIFFLQSDPELRTLFNEIFEASQRKVGVEIFSLLHRLTFEYDLEIDGWVPESERLSYTVSGLRELTSITNWATLIDLLGSGQISDSTALDLIKLFNQGRGGDDVRQLVQQFNWWMVNDAAELERICRLVCERVPKLARKFAKTGKRRPRSMLIQQAQTLLNNRTDESLLWETFERILRPDKVNK